MATHVHPVEEKAQKTGGCENGCKGCGCSGDSEAREGAAAKPTIRAIKKILVAVDHPDHPALAMALSLGAPLNAEVAVVHVFDTVSIVNSESAYVYTQSMEQMRIDAKNLVKEVEASLPERAKAFTCLREGSPADEIISAAAEWVADLIVMGTHRKSVVSRAMLGSVSQGVLRHGRCPVLFVDDATPR